jgi:hypothetical protein
VLPGFNHRALEIQSTRRRTGKPHIEHKAGRKISLLPARKFVDRGESFSREVNRSTKVIETSPDLGVVINDEHHRVSVTHDQARFDAAMVAIARTERWQRASRAGPENRSTSENGE